MLDLDAGHDSNVIWVRLGSQRFEMAAPETGVGGVEVVVSPDERWAALFVYSGQSSQGYLLFELTPTLRHSGGLAETIGEGTWPVFSPSSKWVAMVMVTDFKVRGGAYFEDVQDDDSTEPVTLEWAQLTIQRVGLDVPTTRPIDLEIARATPIDTVMEWNAYDSLRFAPNDDILVTTPLGTTVRVKPE